VFDPLVFELNDGELLCNEVFVTASARFHENTIAAIFALHCTCFTHGINYSHVTTSETSIIDFDHVFATVGVFFNPTVHKLRISSQI